MRVLGTVRKVRLVVSPYLTWVVAGSTVVQEIVADVSFGSTFISLKKPGRGLA